MASKEGATRIAVVGGGAGGLELAIRLARLTRVGGRAQVFLIDRRPTHIWKPRLHEIGAGLLVPAEEEAGYAAQALRHGFTFLLGEVDRLDAAARTLSIAPVPYPAEDRVTRDLGDDLLPARTLAYDIAILALGSTVNDFGIPGVREHCYALDTPEEAQRLHRAVLARAARVKEGVQERLQVVIVGGGTTGVELAAELRNAACRLAEYRSLLRPDQLGLALVEMADRPLPSSSQHISDYARTMLAAHDVDMRFGAKVVEVRSDAVLLAGDDPVPADLVVWASGVKPRRLAAGMEGLQFGQGGRLVVDAELRIQDAEGRRVEGLYAIGDCAAAPVSGGGVVAATAQAAHQQAQLLARSIVRQLRGREALPFRYRYKGTLVSLGEGAAVGDVPTPIRSESLRVSGAGAKLAYTGLYEAHLAELFGVRGAVALAVSSLLRRSAQPAIKLYW